MAEETNNYVDKRESVSIAFEILNNLCKLYEKKIDIKKYFFDNNINSVAIYGAGVVGRHLYAALDVAGMQPKYYIDRKAKDLNLHIEEMVLDVPDNYPQIDALIVSVPKYFFEVESEMHLLMPDVEIVSVEWIFDYLF